MATEKVSIPKCSDLSSEDPRKFLESFHSYSLLGGLYNLDGDSSRKLVAFHLRLAGLALVWFQTLPRDPPRTWDRVHSAFQTKYIKVDNDPVLLAENEFSSN